MDSEKAIYWVTLGVLAMATISSSVTAHTGWGDGLAERSIVLMSQASERASNYAQIAGLVLGGGKPDWSNPSTAVAELQNEVQNEVQNEAQDEIQGEIQNEIQANIQNRLACVQRTLVRRQSDLARLQATRIRVRVRMLERSPRTIVSPRQDLVIEVPQPPQDPVETF
jgi:hypothetical protein